MPVKAASGRDGQAAVVAHLVAAHVRRSERSGRAILNDPDRARGVSSIKGCNGCNRATLVSPHGHLKTFDLPLPGPDADFDDAVLQITIFHG
ncbi:hypothetical protein SAMN05216371_8085 [Streptomyces sp. TLI_053]|uniref:hypothetical protein n=1 Tax=Streptomyces sp. TLI_053 TaxID=1855352 RepID=UPI000879D8B1|nr:hypothetical protein [Streptomyces sp. TLI_053]SDT83268.1 hypothetical protein SAMN05216371_8085 [Streptomyces sp. TLI_053]